MERLFQEAPELPFFKAAPLLETFDFERLPIELRLRILRSTHLGPPETGGYTRKFDKLLVHDGELDLDNFSLITGITWFPRFVFWQ